jgi:hypothetical protein
MIRAALLTAVLSALPPLPPCVGAQALAPPAPPLTAAQTFAPADFAACDSLLAGYIWSVLAGDVTAAAACWRPADLAASTRLGITFPDAPLKVDGDSPLWLRREALRARRLTCRREPPQPGSGGTGESEGIDDPGAVRQDLSFTADADTIHFTYHFRRTAGSWRLASPVALAREGDGVAGRYVVLHDIRTKRSGTSSAAAVAMLDSCVEAMADRLGMSGADRERLRQGRLGYLLADPGTVTRLAGAPTIGVANLQQDVVITSHPCHAHELAHLVVTAWLRELPTYMLPVLQEGVAVHLGGRWGRHPRVMERVGRVTLTDGWVALDDLLTRDGFQALPPDLSYAPAGTLAAYILDAYGPAGLRAACLAVADDLETLTTLDDAAVQDRLSRALGSEWPRIAADFNRHLARPVASGIVPGAATAPPAMPDTTLDGGRCRVAITFDADKVTVTVDPVGSAALAGGALLFGGSDRALPPNTLYAEHFPGRTCHDESHALLFTAEEAKLYDYRLQSLVALHAEGFWPSPDYHDQHSGGIRLSVDRRLWPEGAIVLVEPDGR